MDISNVEDIANSKAPRFTSYLQNNVFLQACGERLKNMVHTVLLDDGTVVRGAAVVDCLVKMLEAKDKKEIVSEDSTPLQVFAYLTPELDARIDKLTTRSIANMVEKLEATELDAKLMKAMDEDEPDAGGGAASWDAASGADPKGSKVGASSVAPPSTPAKDKKISAALECMSASKAHAASGSTAKVKGKSKAVSKADVIEASGDGPEAMKQRKILASSMFG